MEPWIRKLRGISGIAAAWGLAGALVGSVAGAAAAVLGGLTLGQWIDLALGAGGCGVVLGSGFALALTSLERCRSAEDLSPGRAAVWGALAGAVLPIGLIAVTAIPMVGAGILHPKLLLAAAAASAAYGILGATLAAITLSLSRLATPELEGGAARSSELLGMGDG